MKNTQKEKVLEEMIREQDKYIKKTKPNSFARGLEMGKNKYFYCGEII